MYMIFVSIIFVFSYHNGYRKSYKMNNFKRIVDSSIILSEHSSDARNMNAYHRFYTNLYAQSFESVNAVKEGKDYNELMKCLSREYASFFDPMEKKFYAKDVQFIDPLNEFQGIGKYQNNVDLLAGRTRLGSFLFTDASISMHSIRLVNVADVINGISNTNSAVDDLRIETRWTLQVSIKSLPWKPRARFTGISLYTLDRNGIIQKQEVYLYSTALPLLSL